MPWSEVIARPVGDAFDGIVMYLPTLLGAAVLLVFGLIVATSLAFLVQKILESARFDKLLEKLGLKQYTDRAGIELRGSYFVGRIIFWIFTVIFILAVSDALGLKTFSEFVRSGILAFLPRVIGAVLIALASFVLANLARGVVLASAQSAKLHGSETAAALAWWAIVVFGVLTALEQLIEITMLQTVVTGVIAAAALAFGIAFGLGGKDYASRMMEKLDSRRK